MSIDSLNIGVQGFQDAQLRAQEAAQSIASQSVKDASVESIDQRGLASSLVDLKSAEIDARANAKVIQTASDVLGTLIDIKV